MLERFVLEHKTAGRVLISAIWHSYGPAIFTGIFALVLFVLQWVFNYELFFEILFVNDASLSLADRLDVFNDAMLNVFRYSNDLTPISLLLISFFQASILTIWWRMRNVSRSAPIKIGSLGVGVLGSGCVACGSSLVPVLFNVVGSTLSVGLVQAVGDILLVLAVVLSYRATLKIALRSAAALV